MSNSYLSILLGWYDRTNIGEFKTLVDVGMVAAMGPPGGGRNPVTMRLMRHFHYISFTEMEYNSKVSFRIYCLTDFLISGT